MSKYHLQRLFKQGTGMTPQQYSRALRLSRARRQLLDGAPVTEAMYAAGYSPWEIDSLFNTEQFEIMAEGGVEPHFQYYFKQDQNDASLLSLRFDLDTTLQTSLPTNLRSPALLDFEQMRGFSPASAATGYDMDSLFVPFRCVASDITEQRSVVFRHGDLAQAVRASMSYPFYFKPIRVNAPNSVFALGNAFAKS